MNQKLKAAVAAFSIFAALTVTSNQNPPADASKRASDGVQHHQATYPLDRESNALGRDSEALGRDSEALGRKAARLAVLSGFEIESSLSDPWVLMSDVERLESVVLEPED